LPFKKISTSSLGYQRKSYRSSALDCAGCPLRSQCIGKSDFKKIEDTIKQTFVLPNASKAANTKSKAYEETPQQHSRARTWNLGKLFSYAPGKYPGYSASQ